MKLGAFSISLSVKDLEVSRQFYEHLGFSVFAGDPQKKYYILKNETSLIGIFEGMFEGNIITFNPGWDSSAQELPNFDDVREIQHQLKSNGIELMSQVNPGSKGPGRIAVKDPDGNTILIDQHVSS